MVEVSKKPISQHGKELISLDVTGLELILEKFLKKRISNQPIYIIVLSLNSFTFKLLYYCLVMKFL